MEKLNEHAETGCCPRFNPEPWNEKEISWQDKLFLKDKIKTLFRIPLNFGKIMIKNMEKIKKSEALADEAITLYDCKTMFSADIYISVNKEIEGADMEKISGNFLTKVFEGQYKDTGKWVKEMNEYVSSKGKEMKKLYILLYNMSEMHQRIW